MLLLKLFEIGKLLEKLWNYVNIPFIHYLIKSFIELNQDLKQITYFYGNKTICNLKMILQNGCLSR